TEDLSLLMMSAPNEAVIGKPHSITAKIRNVGRRPVDLRTAFEPDGDESTAVNTAIGALVAAADEDTATGGPDLVRDILPNVVAIDADGIRDVDDDVIRQSAERALGRVR
ncbi:MAG: hypothetical protein R3324_19845, partial [Halobacteriales archaeon]|nr:hypothetical protein [Halobacteriales archaeon]